MTVYWLVVQQLRQGVHELLLGPEGRKERDEMLARLGARYQRKAVG